VSSLPATPRTPSVPNRRPMTSWSPSTSGGSGSRKQPAPQRVGRLGAPGLLTLGGLSGLPGLFQAVLLALLDPGVAGQEAGLLQRRAVLLIDQDEAAGDPEAQRPGLAGDPAPGDQGDHVELALGTQGDEGLADDLLVDLVGEVALERTAVDLPLASARHQPDASDRFLAPSGATGLAGHDGTAGRRLTRLGRGLAGVLGGGVLAVDLPGGHTFGACVVDGRFHTCGLSHGYFLVLPCLERSSARRSWLLRDLLDLKGHRRLGLVRVIGPRVHLQLAKRLPAERVLWQHAPDRLLDDPLGVLLHQLAIAARPQATRVPGVPIRPLLLQLVAAQRDLVRVDDDHEVTGVPGRG